MISIWRSTHTNTRIVWHRKQHTDKWIFNKCCAVSILNHRRQQRDLIDVYTKCTHISFRISKSAGCRLSFSQFFGILLQQRNFIAWFPVASHFFLQFVFRCFQLFLHKFLYVFPSFVPFCVYFLQLFNFLLFQEHFFFIQFLFQNLCSTCTVHYILCFATVVLLLVSLLLQKTVSFQPDRSNRSEKTSENQYIWRFKMDKCMPAAPRMVGREFVKKYYTIMNKSPENLVI